MKPLDEQDHYEVLEIARSARVDEVERAFHIARATYAEDSLALYSVFESDGAAVIRDRITTAYRVLSNAQARREYDEMMFGVSEVVQEREPSSAPEYSPSAEVYEEMEAEAEEGGQTFDGSGLRRARMRRGIELDQIADITKVSCTNLRYLENENFGEYRATLQPLEIQLGMRYRF